MDLIIMIVVWSVIVLFTSFFNKVRSQSKSLNDNAPTSPEFDDYSDLSAEELEALNESDELFYSAEALNIPPSPSFQSIDNGLNSNVSNKKAKSTRVTQLLQEEKHTDTDDKLSPSSYQIKSKSDLKRAVVWAEILARKY